MWRRKRRSLHLRRRRVITFRANQPTPSRREGTGGARRGSASASGWMSGAQWLTRDTAWSRAGATGRIATSRQFVKESNLMKDPNPPVCLEVIVERLRAFTLGKPRRTKLGPNGDLHWITDGAGQHQEICSVVRGLVIRFLTGFVTDLESGSAVINHPKREGMQPSMRIATHDKCHIVELEDGSRWRIWPGDVAATLQWMPTTELQVVGIDDECCSHVLVSETDGTQVKVISADRDWPVETVRRHLRRG
jgi:hypothetical protein